MPSPILHRVHMEMTLTDQDMLVWDAWYTQNGWDAGSVRDIFSGYVIVKNSGMLYRYDYSVDEEAGSGGNVQLAEKEVDGAGEPYIEKMPDKGLHDFPRNVHEFQLATGCAGHMP